MFRSAAFPNIPTLFNWVPTACHVCNAWPGLPNGQGVCLNCMQAFADHLPRCKTCALRLESPSGQCGACLVPDDWLDGCVAAVDYGYPWSGLIARFKFGGDIGWARTFAAAMINAPGAIALLESADKLVPLPLTPLRLGERGYNQAWLLVQALCKSAAFPGQAQPEASLLIKTRDTTPQHNLDRQARIQNLNAVFTVTPRKLNAIRHKRVLLVDDIMTTGATLRAAAQALKMAGAREVYALVFARTPAK